MSHDISFVFRAPGQDWEDALDSTGDSPEPSPEERARLRAVLDRIEGRAQGILGPWERRDAEEGSLVGELSDPATGVQIGVYSSMASLSHPSWQQDDPAAFHGAVRHLVAVISDETGMEAYDPQAGGAFEAERRLGAQRPRRDGIGLLMIGVVVTLVALLMLAVGNRGFWTWTALAVGVLDILLGGRRLTGGP